MFRILIKSLISLWINRNNNESNESNNHIEHEEELWWLDKIKI